MEVMTCLSTVMLFALFAAETTRNAPPDTDTAVAAWAGADPTIRDAPARTPAERMPAAVRRLEDPDEDRGGVVPAALSGPSDLSGVRGLGPWP